MNTSNNSRRIVVLDTETTGMNREGGPTYLGHRIIEIGAVEIVNRKLTGRHFHVYIKPDREIQPEAIAVHGITDEFLLDKPEYKDIHKEFLAFIDGAELVAHNAPFDVGFMDNEFQKLDRTIGKTQDHCKITDTLAMAKRLPNMPARKNLDSLAKHFTIDISARVLHGALLDAEILADVYLFMTGGQTAIQFNGDNAQGAGGSMIQRVASGRAPLKVIKASDEELAEHTQRLKLLSGEPNW
ncbi:DNA polymerase III subunit epsilon [Vibrio sp. UCD-FRSSP16_10]|uniref:DNA polymerase III subunit epsilon n=1 Tax=unclassified Vibrio TaxID=2614977 RepID=UPI0008010CA8|nr:MULTISPECIES: DNA polymerase III subunit epsilon [unclassified Vibrio]OBT16898.1 DNA polymerase III subunit epsilon [Vibrio sp. UCD-FRSSP16_30]OBT21886.1 DNA polymerase III subunit epsilon [Vibrio sp. UCD-FRSSP16_10]